MPSSSILWIADISYWSVTLYLMISSSMFTMWSKVDEKGRSLYYTRVDNPINCCRSFCSPKRQTFWLFLCQKLMTENCVNPNLTKQKVWHSCKRFLAQWCQLHTLLDFVVKTVEVLVTLLILEHTHVQILHSALQCIVFCSSCVL